MERHLEVPRIINPCKRVGTHVLALNLGSLLRIRGVGINRSFEQLDMRIMARGSKVSCVACGSVIKGRPVPMRLKITHNQQKLLNSAKALGFKSSSWAIDDVMQAPMHRKCFNFATRVWRLAFVTRALSPRRHPGEATHPHLE